MCVCFSWDPDSSLRDRQSSSTAFSPPPPSSFTLCVSGSLIASFLSRYRPVPSRSFGDDDLVGYGQQETGSSLCDHHNGIQDRGFIPGLLPHGGLTRGGSVQTQNLKVLGLTPMSTICPKASLGKPYPEPYTLSIDGYTSYESIIQHKDMCKNTSVHQYEWQYIVYIGDKM